VWDPATLRKQFLQANGGLSMTSDRSPSAALRVAGALLTGAVCAAGAGFALVLLLSPETERAMRARPLAAVAVVLSPLAAAIVPTLFWGSRRETSAGTAARPQARARRPHTEARQPGAALLPSSAPGAPQPVDAALQLLALLQQEGRLVDFLEEDLSTYADEQIGAAVRPIHEGCRAVLRDRLVLAPILPGVEGATVTVARGFDPAAVRITGNVRGEPPYRGLLRHPGWRSAGLKLPVPTGDQDPSILAPAEVEVT
jgi:hypothetical protein